MMRVALTAARDLGRTGTRRYNLIEIETGRTYGVERFRQRRERTPLATVRKTMSGGP
jgi:hypothetical protein